MSGNRREQTSGVELYTDFHQIGEVMRVVSLGEEIFVLFVCLLKDVYSMP